MNDDKCDIKARYSKFTKETSFLQDVSEVSDLSSEQYKKSYIHENHRIERKMPSHINNEIVTDQIGSRRASIEKNSFNIQSYKSNLEKVDMILKETGKSSFNTNFTSIKSNSPMNNLWSTINPSQRPLLDFTEERPDKFENHHTRNISKLTNKNLRVNKETKLAGLMSRAKGQSRNEIFIDQSKSHNINKQQLHEEFE